MKKPILVALAVIVAVVPFFLRHTESGQTSFKPRKYVTENVIVINTDGLRFEDGFGSEEKYMSHIWNDIRPNGAIFTRMYNETCTYTAPGHAQCVTGAWQYEPNNGRIRPSTPTMFEYYRRQFDAPPEDVCILPGKGNCWHLNYSTFPGFGRNYEAPFYALGYGDDEIASKLSELLLTTRPKLVYAILPHVDSVGHSGDYRKYTESISHADELIWKIWQQIQFNPDYKDKTTLIITTDHGRHAEGVRDGFKSHGDSCEGCRHTYCVMIGPDVKKGFVYQDECFQVDIVPTVGELLGFATPACDGSSLTKALVDRLAKEIPDEQKAYILSLETECRRFKESKYDQDLSRMLDASLKIPVASLGHSMNDAIFLKGVLDASVFLKDSKGINYVRSWADSWMAKDAPRDDVTDSLCGEILFELFDATNDLKYRDRVKGIADWVMSKPFGVSEKGALLCKKVRAPKLQVEAAFIKADTLYAVVPLLCHSQKIFGGDYAKFALGQYEAHKKHLADEKGLFRHFAVANANSARLNVNPINWVRGNAFALGSILEASLILGENKDLYKQISELITKEPLGDQIIMRQQQNGLWMDDLSGQVSDYDTVANAMLIGEISKWQGDKLSRRTGEGKPSESCFDEDEPATMSVLPDPKKKLAKESALNGSMYHVIGAWDSMWPQISKSGLVYGCAEPAYDAQLYYQSFVPPVYSKDRGFYKEGQGAFMSALVGLSSLCSQLGPVNKRIPPIK
ncbi:MAG: sulfatase-like hydrolase/transferase [Caldisericales bacterium]|nr:sulfatase-like hydrolase/transferase [Caldisericales bacterium]